MNSKIFRQYEGAWANEPYPTKRCTVSGAGCGLVACTHIAIEQERYKNWTPENLRPWMVNKGFAIANQGTRWEGITETLKYLGHKNVVRVYNDPMSVAFKELNKGNRIGIFLFSKGRGGSSRVLWTTCGHYVAFVDYKYENGKHWFYTKDSGGRKHDGWYSYEGAMKGIVSKMWIVERINPIKTVAKPAVTADGKLVVDGVGGEATVKAMQRFFGTGQDGIISGQNKTLAKYYPSLTSVKYAKGGSPCIKNLQRWVGANQDGIIGQITVKLWQKKIGVKQDGIFGVGSMKAWQKYLNEHDKAVYPTPTPTPKPTTWVDKANAWARSISNQKYHYVRWSSNSKTHTCPICTGRKYNDAYGWNCIGYAFGVWRHGGGLKNKCSCGVISSGKNGQWDRLLKVSQAEANKLATQWIGVPVTVIRNGGKAIPVSQLKAGDICCLYSGGTAQHIIYYMGNGKYSDSNTTGGIGSAKNIRADLALSSSFKSKLKLAIRYTGK